MCENPVAARAAADDVHSPEPQFVFRRPRQSDGAAVWRLIRECAPLDENSLYCNLLQCTHFADTCIIGEIDGEIAGWISGYRPPQNSDVLFVWQVAIRPSARGEGLARTLLLELLASRGCNGVNCIQTTITDENAASWALFRSFSKRMNARLRFELLFDRMRDFKGDHDSEYLVTIGPFDRE
ncbi:MAG: diaminobutyrate acetyltransferase [Alphaproteobacteria bacterium]|nr:diaminobutyrate acetyltransferase [Alphaproteobacteria bacterium]